MSHDVLFQKRGWDIVHELKIDFDTGRNSLSIMITERKARPEAIVG